MDESVLNTVKKMLGISSDYDCFDQDIIVHINAVLAILDQIGVATTDYISGDDETWGDVLANYLDRSVIETVKSYMYFKVRMMFDPPTSGSVSDSMKSMISELEWRLNTAADK